MKANNMLASPTSQPRAHHAPNVLMMRLVFLVCFVMVLPVALFAALAGWRWQPWPPGAHGYRPVLSEAMSTAKVLTATVFPI